MSVGPDARPGPDTLCTGSVYSSKSAWLSTGEGPYIGKAAILRAVSQRQRLLILLLCAISFGFDWSARLPRLRSDLESGDAALRLEAVRGLAALPGRRGGPDVLAALGDDDLRVRLEASQAAARLGLSEAAEVLTGWLDDEDPQSRRAAISALSELGAAGVTAKLLRALGDVEASVREEATRALGRIGRDVPVSALSALLDDAEPGVRRAAADALGRLGDGGATMALMGHVEDPDPGVRAATLSALGELGDPLAVSALSAALEDSAADVRLRAALALGRIPGDQAVSRLVALTEGTHTRLGRAALAALAGHDTQDARVALYAAVRRPRLHADALAALRAQATEFGCRDRLLTDLSAALARSSDEGAVTSFALGLSELLRDRPSEIPVEALRRAVDRGQGRMDVLLAALAHTGSEAAVLPIFSRLERPQARVRAAALSAAEIYLGVRPGDGRAADPLLSLLRRVSGELGPLPTASTQPVTTEGARTRMRIRLLALLGSSGAARALPRLIAATDSESAAERLAAVRAIGRLGVSEGADSLMALLADDDARVRFEVAQAIGQSADAADMDRLLSTLRDPAPTDRQALLVALGGVLERLGADLDLHLSARALQLLVALSAHRDLRLAARALDTLARWGDSSALSALDRAPDPSSPVLRRQRAWVLSVSARSDALPLPEAQLMSPDPLLAAAAFAGLGERRGSEVVDLVLDAVAERPFPVDAAASFALARLARRGLLDAASAPRLCALLARRHPATRANVMVALAAIHAPACAVGTDPARLLRDARSPQVRAAAMRWLYASRAADAGPILRRCLEQQHDAAVLAACQAPALPALGREADVYAYASDGESVLAGALVAVSLADSSQWLCPTDALSHLRLAAAPEGPMRLWLPDAVALEP